ncbi:magnesium transporter [Limibacillus halophilus]|uniref:Magnesium transporter MgtE n=1 Tax=Limibacillus halophilus TaxID=1579333 RepID=A0A839SQB5_9PROT|nr:magnesium transporter [Limibacillus halophilus]MBB3064418.1 magnesium transporter [Limibacillus halophilus]
MVDRPPEQERPEENPPQEQVGVGIDTSAEGSLVLPEELISSIHEALAAGDVQQAEVLVHALHPADAADILEILSADERTLLVEILGATIDPEVLSHLEPTIREEVLEQLGAENLARVLMHLDSDDAVEIFEDLEEDAQQHILSALPLAYRHILQEGLSYPEDSAGRLMAREFVAIPQSWTIGQTIDYLRAAEDLPDIFYDLYVVNPKHKPVGIIPLSRAIGARRPEKLGDLMDQELRTIPLTMDQEDVAYIFRQYGLASAPVVDAAGRLVGTITVDDVVLVIEEEAEEDIMKLAGVAETDLYDAAIDTAKARFTWLLLNLGTAVLASLVIGLFSGTIEKVVALAVLMPIVASMGGNAGTQTLTVAVRAIAMRDLGPWNALRFVGKEVIVGAANGVIFALVMGLVAWLWFDSAMIGLIIGVAMVLNLVVAALFGTLIPLGLERLKIDPAVASSVFLTTVTDVVGFLAFLGLAALMLT